MKRLDEGAFAAWHAWHRPDVVVFIHTYDVAKEFAAFLRREKFGVPGRLGVAAVTHLLEGTGLSGMQQDQRIMGARAVELLVARVTHRDLGIPANPRTELVESRWFDGGSLRSVEAPHEPSCTV
jgi:DNA-binding LacI/PurR family transcriptional regulator